MCYIKEVGVLIHNTEVTMSSHLSQLQLGQLSIQNLRISKRKWLDALEHDDDFSCIVDEGDVASAVYSKQNQYEQLHWQKGKTIVEQPSDALISKLEQITDRLYS